MTRLGERGGSGGGKRIAPPFRRGRISPPVLSPAVIPALREISRERELPAAPR